MSTSTPTRKSWRVAQQALVVLLCLLLVACGFSLRGAMQVPPALERIHVSGDSLLAMDVAIALQRAGSEILLEPRPGEAVLEIQEDELRRRVVAVSPEGRAQEYQLQMRVSYRVILDDEELLAPQSLELTREFSAGGGERVLGREAEADELEQEIRNDAVRLILQQLERLSESAPEATE